MTDFMNIMDVMATCKKSFDLSNSKFTEKTTSNDSNYSMVFLITQPTIQTQKTKTLRHCKGFSVSTQQQCKRQLSDDDYCYQHKYQNIGQDKFELQLSITHPTLQKQKTDALMTLKRCKGFSNSTDQNQKKSSDLSWIRHDMLEKTIKSLKSVIEKPISKSERPGFIYVFKILNGNIYI